MAKFGGDVTTDHEFYLNRIDKIFLDKEGSFKVVVDGAEKITEPSWLLPVILNTSPAAPEPPEPVDTIETI